jgi:3-deoxy-D-manno-octulosonic-acid transferase
MTTGTVTSATLLASKLPPRALHQFVPVDLPLAVNRFLNHWKPDAALWVESEFWPNLLRGVQSRSVPVMLVNARLSEKSFRMWQGYLSLIRPILYGFRLIFPQSRQDGQRLEQLAEPGRPFPIHYEGNLKYDTPALTAQEDALAILTGTIGSRPVWMGASTHPTEEAMLGQVHQKLKPTRPNLLTVIAPRHAHRGSAIAEELAAQGLSVALRSRGDAITAQTDIYLADTMGELGLFYRLAPIVFMGGSLIPHGGQNLLEAARLRCAVVAGPHMENFAEICEEFEAEQACLRVENLHQLAETISQLMEQPDRRQKIADRGLRLAESKQGTIRRLLAHMEPLLTQLTAATEKPKSSEPV